MEWRLFIQALIVLGIGILVGRAILRYLDGPKQ